ncbi:MAG: hypothetical protein ACYC49_09310 [Ignavibacteriaceae bacterium]
MDANQYEQMKENSVVRAYKTRYGIFLKTFIDSVGALNTTHDTLKARKSEDVIEKRLAHSTGKILADLDKMTNDLRQIIESDSIAQIDFFTEDKKFLTI